MPGEVGDGVEPGVADPGRVGPPLDVDEVARFAPAPDDRVERRAGRHPVGVARVAGVGGQVGALQEVAREPLPLAVAGRAEHHGLPVARGVGAVGRHHRGTHADRRGLGAAVQHGVQREAHHLRDHVEHRDRDHGAVPGALPVVQRGEHRGVGVERRADVGDGYPRLRGRPGQAGDRAGPALGLHEQVVGALVVQRSAGAVPGDVDDDQPGVPLGQVGRGEAEAAERARRQVADQHVGPAEQAGEHLGVGRFGQVRAPPTPCRG